MYEPGITFCLQRETLMETWKAETFATQAKVKGRQADATWLTQRNTPAYPETKQSSGGTEK
jgi:hypothetical protein